MRQHDAETETSRAEDLEPLGALLHPLWLTALGVMVLNDHLLKALLGVPTLTGKLSDVAGLIVAPVLLAAILRVRRLRGLWACVGLVAAGFAAINLWPAAAQTWDAAIGLAGGSPTTFTDPTDLLALPVAALGTWMLVPTMDRTPRRSGIAPAWVLAAAGALACLGSSDPIVDPAPVTYDARVSVLNKTNELQVLRVRPLAEDLQLNCSQVAEAPSEYLSAEAFGAPTRWELMSGQQLGLGGAGQSGRSRGTGQNECRAARISVETSDDIVVFWDDSLEIKEFRANPQQDKEKLGGAQTVSLTADYSAVESDEQMHEFRNRPCEDGNACGEEGRREAAQIPEGATYEWAQKGGERLYWEIPDRTERARREIPEVCSAPIDNPGLAWIDLPRSQMRIRDVDSNPDGCHSLKLSEPRAEDGPSASSQSYTICAPWEALSKLDPTSSSKPMFVDPLVESPSSASSGTTERLELYVTRGRGTEAEEVGNLVLLRGDPAAPLPASTGWSIPTGCGPKTRSCGRADIAARMTFSEGSSERSVSAGGSVTLESPTRTIHLVRAYYRSVARPASACESESTPPATRLLGGVNGFFVEAVVVRGFSN